MYIVVHILCIYMYIQGDQNVSVYLITVQKVTSNAQSVPRQSPGSDCLAADRQGQGDTRFTITLYFTPNSNNVIMVSD
jgi:hypothetical protein